MKNLSPHSDVPNQNLDFNQILKGLEDICRFQKLLPWGSLESTKDYPPSQEVLAQRIQASEF